MTRRILVTAMAAAGLLLFSRAKDPYERRFDMDDGSISRPFKSQEAITFVETIAVSVAVPLILFFGVFCINPIERRDEIALYMSFLLSCLVTSTIVENMKILFGRLRPDFLERCRPEQGTCTGNPRTVAEGRKSFPSGHTSVVACGFMFLVLFLYREHRLPRLRRKKVRFLILPLVLMSVVVPVAVGVSRVIDNRHFVSDVLGGGVIGMAVGMLEFRYLEKTAIPGRYRSSTE